MIKNPKKLQKFEEELVKGDITDIKQNIPYMIIGGKLCWCTENPGKPKILM